jgi:hypothetical protein
MNPNSKSPLNRVKTAIRTLAPDSSYHSDGAKIIEWLTPDIPQPSELDIEAKVAEYKIKWDAQAYARERATSYPSVGDQLDMMMKDKRDGTTTHQTACEAVKTQFPKE